MPATDSVIPLYVQKGRLWQWSVARYHQLLQAGILMDLDRFEFLEGYLVRKPDCSDAVREARGRLSARFTRLREPGWQVRVTASVTLSDSEPEPDTVLARGGDTTFAERRPAPGEIGLVVEVSQTRLDVDRNDMARIYARAGLPVYWIINVVDRQVELYTDPRPADPVPAYATRTDYRPGDAVPLVLDGRPIAQLPVPDLLG